MASKLTSSINNYDKITQDEIAYFQPVWYLSLKPVPIEWCSLPRKYFSISLFGVLVYSEIIMALLSLKIQ